MTAPFTLGTLPVFALGLATWVTICVFAPWLLMVTAWAAMRAPSRALFATICCTCTYRPISHRPRVSGMTMNVITSDNSTVAVPRRRAGGRRRSMDGLPWRSASRQP